MASIIKKILITGDSFAAEWPDCDVGWVNLLKNNYEVTNIAQAGVGEYKILSQIRSVNINDYDAIIVSHTSPSRVHTVSHPIHKQGFHQNCDLIITDIENRLSCFNDSLRTAKKWFEYHYDDNYQIEIYKLIRKEINSIIDIPYLSLSHIPLINQLRIEKDHIDFSDLWISNRGKINHYTKEANIDIFNKVVAWIQQQ